VVVGETPLLSGSKGPGVVAFARSHGGDGGSPLGSRWSRRGQSVIRS
jgi:hypothetical protein